MPDIVMQKVFYRLKDMPFRKITLHRRIQIL